MLTIAVVDNGNEIASWTKDERAVLTAKQKELLNMDKFGVVEVVDRQQVGTKIMFGRIFQNANCGNRIWAYLSVQMQTSTQERQGSRL